MEKELQKINELIKSFNQSDFKFELELRIFNKDNKVYMKLDQIMAMVCKATGLTPEYLNMKIREPHILLPRQFCHYIASKNTKCTLAAIGAYFGGKDHSTVLSSIKKIQGYLDTDREFREKYGDLLNPDHSTPTNDNS